MRALQYEGTRAEIAQNFREQGNDMARAKRWKDGKEFYTKGLAALKQPQSMPPSNEDGKPLPDLNPEAEAKKERAVEEACYINRALCNLELRASPTFLPPPRPLPTPSTNLLTSASDRELPLHNPRLCLNTHPKPHQHQSPLPLRHRPPRPPQTPRSPRCLHPRPSPRPHQPRPHLPLPKTHSRRNRPRTSPAKRQSSHRARSQRAPGARHSAESKRGEDTHHETAPGSGGCEDPFVAGPARAD